ncbi:MAG: WD40 repeat domain-containing protein [Polyangiaceae bacterium]
MTRSDPGAAVTKGSAGRPSLRYPKPLSYRAAQADRARVVRAHSNAISAIDSTEDGKSVLTASIDQTAKIWETDDQAEGDPGDLEEA